MKSIILVAFALVAVAVAAPVEDPIETVRSEFNQQPDGSYNRGFETSNGIQVQENGELKEVLDEDNKPQIVLVVRGSYAYVDPEGNPVQVTYSADETGFHAESDRIPQAPVARR